MNKFQHLLLLSFFFIFSVVVGQTEKQKIKVKEFFWGENDLATKEHVIPEKWNNESEVVLFKHLDYDYNKSGAKVSYTSSIRKKVFLKDKVAVDKYSEFSKEKNFFSRETKYWLRKNHEFLGIRIFKASGTVEEVDIEKFSVKKDKRSYISIPNLEPGDILDFYIQVKQVFYPSSTFVFEPVEYILSEVFPIVKLKVDLKVDNNFEINYKSFNGAPKLESYNNEKRYDRTFGFEVDDIEKVKFEKWSYYYNNLPCFKMQLFFFMKEGNRLSLAQFTSKAQNSVKDSVTDNEILEMYSKHLKPQSLASSFRGDIEDYLNEKKPKTKKEELELVYYYYRNRFLIRDVEYMRYKYDGIFENIKHYYEWETVGIGSSTVFIEYFTKYLKKQKIDYEIIVAKNRFDGSIDDLLLAANVQLAVKINLPSEVVYASYFGLNGVFNSLPVGILSSEAYLLSPNDIMKGKFKKYETIEKFTLGESLYRDHGIDKIINLKLTDFSNFIVEEKIVARGMFKESELKNSMIYLWFKDERENYNSPEILEKIKTNKKQKISITERLKATKSKEKEEFIKRRINQINSENDFTIEDNLEVDFEELGRFSVETPFESTSTYELKDQLIKKAGPNYILEIGKFIGSQQSIKEDELDRSYDVDMPSARQFKNEIQFVIPEGYTVKGLDKLNKSIDNETGKFSSSAEVIENRLIVKTNKIYKKHHIDKSKWLDLVEVLDLAFKFTQEKIMLKKI